MAKKWRIGCGALILSILLAVIAFSGLVLSEDDGNSQTPRVRVLRRNPNTGIPHIEIQEAATGGGAGRSISNGWRVSFNTLGHMKSSSSTSNDTDGWIAVLRNQSTTSNITTTEIPTTFATVNEEKIEIRKQPKKTQIPKFVVGNIIKRNGNPEVSTSTVPPRLPITKVMKNYVEIERDRKKSNNETGNPKSNPRKGEYRAMLNQIGGPETGRARGGFMRRQGEVQQFPHHQHPPYQAQQQYLPLPQPQQLNDGYIDPYHPVIQHNLNQPPHNPLQAQHDMSHTHGGYYQHPPLPVKKHGYNYDTSMIPLDKTLVYVSMIVSWLFWIIIYCATYYNVLPHGRIYKNVGHGHVPSVTVEDSHGKTDNGGAGTAKEKQPHVIHARSLDTSIPSGWNVNWGQVLYMISLAQETYENFDFRSMDCQKKALCELAQKQEDFGETGRKISNTFSVMDAVEGLPMPTIIQNYLKEYREAINHGKDNFKSCSEIYTKCGFSIKDVIAKYQKKAASAKFK